MTTSCRSFLNNNMSTEKEAVESSRGNIKQKLTAYALVPAILCPLCFFFPFGYSIGIYNAATPPLRRFYNQSYTKRYGEPIASSLLDTLWIVTGIFFPVGGALGSFLVRPLVARLGQRRSLVYTQSLCIVATLLMSLSFLMSSYEAVIIGEALLGMFCAVGLGIGSTYISDVSIRRIRGPVGGMFAVSLSLGLIFGNAFGLPQVLGTDSGWPYLYAITALPSIVFLLCSPWMPESPRTAFIINNNEDDARLLLVKLRGTSDIEDEIEELKEEAGIQSKLLTVFQVLSSPVVRKQLISAAVVLSTIQLTGINGVLYNMNNVFIAAGVDPSEVGFASIGVSAGQLVACTLGGFLCERFGRKSLFIVGNVIVTISIILYTLALAFQDSASWLSYVSVVATLGFVFGVNTGSGVVGYVIAPEVLTQSSRPAGMTVAVFTHWLFFIIVSLITPYMFAGLDFAVLLPYMAVAILAILYVYFFVPETKGLTVTEVQKYYSSNRCCCCGQSSDEDDVNSFENDITVTQL